MAKLELVFRGIKRVPAENSHTWSRQSITIDLLRKLHASWSGSQKSRDEVMLWAISSLCFFGFLKSREITVSLDSVFHEASRLSLNGVSLDKLDSH